MDADELQMSDAMGGPFDMDAYRRSQGSRPGAGPGLPAVSSRHDITMMANSDSTSDLLKLDRSQPILQGDGVDFELFDIFHSTTSELGFTGVPGVPHDDTNQFLSHTLGSVASPDIHNKLRGQGSSHLNLTSIRSSPQPLHFTFSFTASQQQPSQQHLYPSSSFIKHDQTLPSHDSPISPQSSQQHPPTRVTFNPSTFHSRESPTSHLFSPTSPNTGIPSLEPASLFPTSTNPLTPHTPVTPLTPGGTRLPPSSQPSHPSAPHHPSLVPSNPSNLPTISLPSDSSSKRITTKLEARSPSPPSPFNDSTGISATPSSSTYSSPYYNGTTDRTSIKNEFDDLNDKNGNSKSRLARKAELARASIRRKKMYVQDLEAKVKKLGAKIEELQQKQAQAKSKRLPASITREEKERKESQKQIRAQLSEITSRKTLDKETQQRLNELVRRFVQNSRERQATVDFYLDRVEDCLTPGLQVKFALWGLDQSDEFYEKPGLWSSLMSKEVGLTEAQLQVVMSKRKYVRQERRALAQCEQMLREVREAITGHLRSLNHHIDEIQNVMTPLQLAKFYMWVENNEWCMQMLNTMFTTPTQQAAAAAAMQPAALSQSTTSSSTSMTPSQ